MHTHAASPQVILHTLIMYRHLWLGDGDNHLLGLSLDFLSLREHIVALDLTGDLYARLAKEQCNVQLDNTYGLDEHASDLVRVGV